MKDFSLQLFSLRDVPQLQSRMEIAANAGYTGVEFAGYEDYSAAELKALLKKLGLRAAGTHIGMDLLKKDLDACIQYCVDAGISSATCPGADLNTREDALAVAAFLENCAVKFEQAGIVFAYHNHAHEFEKIGSDYILEILLHNTVRLGFELDVFWTAYADVEPMAFIRKYAGRFPLLHFKEINQSKENVELGRGSFDFAAIAAVGIAQGVREIVVEQEQYTMPPAESVVVDAAFMKALVL